MKDTNTLAAELLGWEWCEKMLCWIICDEPTLENSILRSEWNPTEDIAQSMMLEEHLINEGLLSKYSEALVKITKAYLWDETNDEVKEKRFEITAISLFTLIHATAEQRTLAFIETITEDRQ